MKSAERGGGGGGRGGRGVGSLERISTSGSLDGMMEGICRCTPVYCPVNCF